MLTGIIFTSIATFLFTGGFAMTFPHFFGLVSRRRYDDSLNTQREARTAAELIAAQLAARNQWLCDNLRKGDSAVAQMRQKISSLEARAIGGDENCPQCARLRKRITRFFEQKKIIKAAYVENVMMVSHGQVDRRALIEAERYLLVDDDNEIRTFGEIRDSEIERSLSLLKHVKTQKQINETTTNPNT